MTPLQEAEQIAKNYAAHCSDIGTLARAFIALLEQARAAELISPESGRTEQHEH